MIRIFVIVGSVGLLVIAYLTTFAVGPITQMPPPESLLTNFRAKGFVPTSVNLEEDERAEEAHVFEVPERDAVELKKINDGGGAMAGMNMPGMKMDGGDGAPKMALNPDGTMKTNPDGSMVMEGEEPKTAMKMDGAEKPAMKMKLNPDGTMAVDADGNMIMEPAEKPAMKMKLNPDGSMALDPDGKMIMVPAGDESKMAMNMAGNDPSTNNGNEAIIPDEMKLGEGGLIFYEDGNFDREIKLDMAEWKFSDMQIDAKMGETIKFTVKNTGQIPHEFMFMNMPLMSAVNYRGTRADWNLLEHRALYEKALVLPGGEFTFVLKVNQPGAWMFMCMLPYHMQMGMMGQMATEGMAMDMKM